MSETIRLHGTIEGRLFVNQTVEPDGDLALINCGFFVKDPVGACFFRVTEETQHHPVFIDNCIGWTDEGLLLIPANPEKIPDEIMTEFARHGVRRMQDGDFRIGVQPEPAWRIGEPDDEPRWSGWGIVDHAGQPKGWMTGR